MSLKAVVEKIEDVSETLRDEYEPGSDGKFYLKIEGFEEHQSAGALKRAKDREKTERAKAEQREAEAREALTRRNQEVEDLLKGVVPKDNLAALERSFNEKLTNTVREKETKITTLQASLDRVLVQGQAQALALKLAKSADEAPVLIPFITKRLAVEIGEDGEARTRVLDEDGKPSASTLDDLAKEIKGKKMFQAILMGSQASGSGASGGGGGGGSAATGKFPTNGTPKEQAAWVAARRAAAGQTG